MSKLIFANERLIWFGTITGHMWVETEDFITGYEKSAPAGARVDLAWVDGMRRVLREGGTGVPSFISCRLTSYRLSYLLLLRARTPQ